MDFSKLYLPCVVLILLPASGCSESGQFVDYASLDAAEPDFVSNGTTDFSGGPAVDPVGAASEALEAVSSTADASTPDAASVKDNSKPPTVDVNQETEDSAAVVEPSALDEEPKIATTEGDNPADPKAVDPLNPDQEKSTEPLEIKLLVKDKRFRSEDDNLRVSYDDIDLLKVLNMEPVPVDAPKYFPEWLKALDGKRIRIRGFMYPTFEATGLRGFTLARDNGICCFVRQPMIYDIIGVDLAEGTTTSYIDNKPFDVEGVFQIVPEADDTELFQLYRIADAKVLNQP